MHYHWELDLKSKIRIAILLKFIKKKKDNHPVLDKHTSSPRPPRTK